MASIASPAGAITFVLYFDDAAGLGHLPLQLEPEALQVLHRRQRLRLRQLAHELAAIRILRTDDGVVHDRGKVVGDLADDAEHFTEIAGAGIQLLLQLGEFLLVGVETCGQGRAASLLLR